MIFAYTLDGGAIERREIGADAALPAQAVWVDLFDPSPEERQKVGDATGLALPTHEEMREIEPSDRLYQESGAAFMTATVISHADDPNPTSDALTFILTARQMITLRYVDPRPIRTFAQRAQRQPGLCGSAEDAFVGLLDAFVDRIADILEKVSLDLDHLSQAIFDDRPSTAKRRGGARRDLRVVLRSLGRNEDLVSTSRESLLSLTRILRFWSQASEGSARKDLKARIKTLNRDLLSLSEHAAFETNKIAFLLNASLGMINIEQNQIIKIFSVAAVVFLPPTLIASIYGMNFDHMPELKWGLGYPMAIGLMIVSAILPYLYFKRKGWL